MKSKKINKIVSAVMCLLLLLTSGAWAQQIDPFFGMTDAEGMPLNAPPEEFFTRGKEALVLLAEGRIDEAWNLLAFVFDVESELSEETFRQAAAAMQGFVSPEAMQTDVALCWLDEMGVWHLGIPIYEPISWDVEVVVLDSRDLQNYCSYSLTDWGTLEAAALTAPYAYWNMEYLPAVPTLLADE
jgi:hypothetical protein